MTAWPKWIRQFERFRHASGLSEKDEVNQVHTLVYSMGDEAEDVLSSFGLSEDERKKYKTALDKFQAYFVKCKNTILERARFNQRKQEEGESVDDFIMDLHCLSEHCGYGALHEEMIRDRIVVGLHNVALSEKLQMDAELDLDKAIKTARQSVTIKHQQTLLRSEFCESKPERVVDSLEKQSCKPAGSPKWKPRKWVPPRQPQQKSHTCTRCGRSPEHTRQQCPCSQGGNLPQVWQEGTLPS